jgi:Holin of 3TMs, for gene-transfer release
MAKVLDFIPDPQKKAEAQLKIQTELDANSQSILAAVTAVDKAQIEVNTEEAKSSNLFVSGWRPAIGWVCGLALTWQYVLQPIVSYILTVSGKPVNLPVFDFSTMSTILMALLGMGGMRTWEKTQGVQNNH